MQLYNHMRDPLGEKIFAAGSDISANNSIRKRSTKGLTLGQMNTGEEDEEVVVLKKKIVELESRITDLGVSI